MSFILAAIRVALGASALFNLFSSSINSRAIEDVKSKQAVLFNHMQQLAVVVEIIQNEIVKV